jgi:hypothetical protein
MNINNSQGLFNQQIDIQKQHFDEIESQECSIFDVKQSYTTDPDDIFEVPDYDFEENFEYSDNETNLQDKLDLLYEDLACASNESEITSIKENISEILNKLIDSGDINHNSIFQL